MTPIRTKDNSSFATVYVLGVEKTFPAKTPIAILSDLAREAGLSKFNVTYNDEVVIDESDLPSVLEAGDVFEITKDDHSA